MQLALRRYPQMCEYGDEEMAKALPSANLMSAAGGKGTLSNLLFEFIRGLVKVLRYTPQQLLVLIARDVFGQSAAAPGLTSKLSYFVVHIMQTSWTRVFIQTGNRAVSFLVRDGPLGWKADVWRPAFPSGLRVRTFG